MIVKRRHTYLFLLSSLVISSCSVFEPAKTLFCPELSEDDFFAFIEGKTWKYDFVDGFQIIPSSTENRLVGTLQLRVESIGECGDEGIQVTLSERIEGVEQVWRHTDTEEHLGWQDEDSHLSNRVVNFTIGAVTQLDDYSVNPIAFDTFRSDANEITIVQTFTDENASLPNWKQITLRFRRGVGLVEWIHKEARHRDDFYRELTLISE